MAAPDASGLLRLWPNADSSVGAAFGAALGIAVAFAGSVAAGMFVSLWAAVGVLAAFFVVAGFVVRAIGRDVLCGPSWKLRGKPIDGQAFQLLEDIDARFAYAEKHVKELPTGIVWSEVEEDVRALLWEAAEHGAQVTALDAQIHEMRYAEPGTAGAALKRRLEEERDAHWQIMRGVQWEAELLARTAGNAVAAAHVALARSGSLAALQRITPSREAIVAAGALAEARSRLELLARVWGELDETGAIAAERLDAERRELPS